MRSDVRFEMASGHARASRTLAAPSGLQRSLREPSSRDSADSLSPERSRADPLSDVLRAVKLRGALFFIVDASTPWGVEVPEAEAFAPIILPRAQQVVSYHVILQGSGWASMPNVAATRFNAGDILVFPHGDAYSMLSAPGQKPEYDAAASLAFFRDMAAGRLPFAVEEGGGGAERARFVCGFLGCDVRPFNPVLSTLPRFLHMRRPPAAAGDLLDRFIDITLAEQGRPCGIGGEAIRLRLSELVFIEVLRRYFEDLPAGRTGWLSGLRDPAVGRALTILHERPADPWTLEELARRAGVSRAVLAERFQSLVGCPAMRYLTLWRIQIAARLLADGATKVAAVGHEVGYESEAAFSRAFKRVVGRSPAEWRDLHA